LRTSDLTETGRFPQVSNIFFEFDPKKPSGSRVVSARIGEEALQPDKKYVVATRGYMARGKGKKQTQIIGGADKC
jgi:hypothetical protein